MWFGRNDNASDRILLDALRALRRGDFEISLPPGLAAADGEIASTFNDIVQIARTLHGELRDVRTAVGRDGRRSRRMRDSDLRGGWAACMWSVNELLDDLLEGAPAAAAGARTRTGTARAEQPPCDRFDTVVELLAGALGAAQARETRALRADAGGSLSPWSHAHHDGYATAQREADQRTRELGARNAELERRLHELSLTVERVTEDAQRHEQASARKSRFMAALSHELRTPLHTMLTFSQKLASDTHAELEPQLAKYVDAIEQAGTDLLQVANDILDAAKLESGAMQVERAAVMLTALAAYAERTFQPRAAQQHVAFGVSVDPDLPVAIEIDDQRVRQILRNLLDNAFKFTARGGVRLSIFLNDRRDGIAFAVTDTGIGIKREDQETIFEPFKQVARLDRPAGQADPGVGLGLSISRDIAHALGGTLHVSSALGRGSTFTLELPLIEAKPVGAGAAGARSSRLRADSRPAAAGGTLLDAPPQLAVTPEPLLQGRTVRVVNGDVRNVFAITAALEPHKVHVVYGERSDAEPAESGAAEAADALLVDIDGPAEGARPTLERIRIRNPRPALLVAVAARSDRSARDICRSAGADDCIGKPLDPAELIATLRAGMG